MARTVTATVTIKVTVDIDKWAETYGTEATAASVREDVTTYTLGQLQDSAAAAECDLTATITPSGKAAEVRRLLAQAIAAGQQVTVVDPKARAADQLPTRVMAVRGADAAVTLEWLTSDVTNSSYATLDGQVIEVFHGGREYVTVQPVDGLDSPVRDRPGVTQYPTIEAALANGLGYLIVVG